MSHNITVEGGTSVRLPTAGKYCDRDIVVTATGGGATDPVIQALEVTANGTYTAPGGVDGYSPVTVNVPSSDGIIAAILDGSVTEIESNVTKIGDRALNYRKKLIKAILPNVTSIGAYAFYESFASATKPTVILPSLTTAGENAFYESGVFKIVLPKLKEISSSMFSKSMVLSFVDLGAATKINGASFIDCYALETLIIRTTSVCSLAYTTVFNNTKIKNNTGYIYVPKTLADGSDGVAAYQAATNWSTFASQIRAIEDYPDITGG
jgi:hypothetical protein